MHCWKIEIKNTQGIRKTELLYRETERMKMRNV